MDSPETSEMEAILNAEEQRLRTLTYEELLRFRTPKTSEVEGPSGQAYQLEVTSLLEKKPGGHLRVLVAIDDFGWRSFAPLTNGFSIQPNGVIEPDVSESGGLREAHSEGRPGEFAGVVAILILGGWALVAFLAEGNWLLPSIAAALTLCVGLAQRFRREN